MTAMQEGEDLVSGLINSDGEFVDWDLDNLGDQKPLSDEKVPHQNASEKNKRQNENQTNIKNSCKLCGKKFGSLRKLSQHKKNHRGVKTFECDHCGKRFAHQNALKGHLEIHAKCIKERPPPCHVSGNLGSARSPNNTHAKKNPGTTSGVEEGDEAVSRFINSDGEEVEWESSTFAVGVNWTGDQQADAGSTQSLRSDVSGNDFASQNSLSRNERDQTKDKPYQCVRCGLRFRFHHNLKKHVRNHLTKKILTRTRCRTMAVRETRGRTSLGENKERAELKEEGRTPTQGEASDAGTSDDECTTSPAKSEHTWRLRPRKCRRKEDSGELFSCGDCDKKFRSVYTRDRHLREKHDKNLRHKCSECEKTFRANRSLMVHRRIYHPSPVVAVVPQEQSRVPKKHLCSTCGKEFPTSASLSRHLIIHSGKRPYKCPVCSRGFTQIGNLKTHQKVHKGVKPTNVTVNEKSSATPEEAPPSAGVCICHLCWTQFSEKKLLEEHMKVVHESKKPYACTECGRRFTHVQKLKEHQAGHEGVKPHQCTQCEKGFQTPQGLENHMRDHTGEKPFRCTICGKRFKQASTLRAHYITHSGERPYLCSICGKSYTRAEELKVHLRVHTGEKPYQCDECGKSFYYRQGFNNHKKTHNAKPIGPTRQLGRPRQQGTTRKASKPKRIPRRRLPDSDGEEDLTWEPPNLGDSPNHHPGSQENHTAPDHSQMSQWSYDHYTSFNPWGQHPNTTYWRGTEGHQQYYGPGEPSMSFSALLRSTTDEEQQVQENCIAWRSGIPLVSPPSEHGLDPSNSLNTTSQKPDSSTRTTEKDDCHEESSTTQVLDQQTSPLGEACEKRAVPKTHTQAEEIQPEEPEQFHATHKPKKTYDCPTCGKVFSNKTGLGRHLVIHSGKRPFNCSLCGKGFTQSGNLKTHLKVHKGEVPTDAALKKSIPETEEPAITFHVCGDCGMDFPEKKQLAEHQKVHDKPYACPHCDKRFKNEYYFKIHKRLHTGDTPFLCSDCGKGCVTLDVLKKHELTHTGEKKFHCDQCGRAFMQSAHLYVHLKTHTGERPHLCSICGKSYSKACDLKVHLRVHTGEKPYTCKICGKSFYYSQGYRAHLKTHETKPKRQTKTLGRPKQKSLTGETDA